MKLMIKSTCINSNNFMDGIKRFDRELVGREKIEKKN
jgi:hypothetical protein